MFQSGLYGALNARERKNERHSEEEDTQTMQRLCLQFPARSCAGGDSLGRRCTPLQVTLSRLVFVGRAGLAASAWLHLGFKRECFGTTTVRTSTTVHTS